MVISWKSFGRFLVGCVKPLHLSVVSPSPPRELNQEVVQSRAHQSERGSQRLTSGWRIRAVCYSNNNINLGVRKFSRLLLGYFNLFPNHLILMILTVYFGHLRTWIAPRSTAFLHWSE